jgi:hypothetical protein
MYYYFYKYIWYYAMVKNINGKKINVVVSTRSNLNKWLVCHFLTLV